MIQRFKTARNAAGLRVELRFHDLRHTFGTLMAAQGVPLRTLQECMRHRDLSTTQIYVDYSPCEREAEYVNRAFAEPLGSNFGSIVSEPDVTGANA